MTTELEQLRAERDRLREALQALHDAQNGPPLINRAAEWERAMSMAAAALAAQPADPVPVEPTGEKTQPQGGDHGD